MSLARVNVASWATANWEIGSPALDQELLFGAALPQTAFVVVTSQQAWFRN